MTNASPKNKTTDKKIILVFLFMHFRNANTAANLASGFDRQPETASHGPRAESNSFL